MSLSWCRQDSDLLLSCGKDNRTICWNPQTGDPYGEFSMVTNWTFQTKWNPHNPSLLATASFDGKIGVQTIQNTKSSSTPNAPAQALDGEDFFNKAQSQPQVTSFTLQKPPRWLQRPCGASFGFGGRLVKFGTLPSENTGPLKSTITIASFAVDDNVGAMTETFANAMKEKNLKDLCETRINQATLESEKTDWKVIETLIAGNPRKELINYLGISSSEDSLAGERSQTNGGAKEDLEPATQDNKTTDKNRLSSFFEAGQDSDNFLAELASTKGAKTNNPFNMYSEAESEAETRVTQALLLGDFEKAMGVCLAEDRLSDAFMIATCGGQNCVEKVQKAYFKKQSSGPRYLRLLASVVGKNLWDIVYNADLQNWKEVMATLCTYASAEEFPDLCETLGDRLEDQSRQHSAEHTWKENASFCYIAGSKLEKVVGVWIAELEYNEGKGLRETSGGSSFSIHARSLQNFIEKVTVFREVTRYQDKDRSAPSNWKLSGLYEKYIEYADIVSAHGQLRTAESYLDLLPDKYPAADVARNRVKQATRPLAPAQSQRQPATTSTSFAPSRPVFEESYPPAPQPSGHYAPSALPQAPGQFAHQNSAPYAPSNYQPTQPNQAPSSRPIVAPPPSFGMPNQGVLRTSGTPQNNPAASKASSSSNWNDTPPEFFTTRRGTPVAPPVASNPVYPNPAFSSSSMPSAAGPPMVIPKVQPAPPPPPPKGPAPPPRAQTPQTSQTYPQQGPERPPSSAANIYAPPPTFSQGQQQGPPQRGTSPYNPPPPGSQPGAGRYAPAPGAAQQPAHPAQFSRPPPPPNPYAVSQNTRTISEGAQSGPPQGPPRGPPVEAGQSGPDGTLSRQRSETSQSSRTQKPPTPKYRK